MIKFNGNITRYSYNEKGEMELTVTIPSYQIQEQIKQCDKSLFYNVQIKEIKRARTLQQNRYMWALCKEIALAMNGDNDSMDIYLNAIESFSNEFIFIEVYKDALEELKGLYRLIKVVDE